MREVTNEEYLYRKRDLNGDRTASEIYEVLQKHDLSIAEIKGCFRFIEGKLDECSILRPQK